MEDYKKVKNPIYSTLVENFTNLIKELKIRDDSKLLNGMMNINKTSAANSFFTLYWII